MSLEFLIAMMNSTHSTPNSCFLFYSCHLEQAEMTIRESCHNERYCADLGPWAGPHLAVGRVSLETL